MGNEAQDARESLRGRRDKLRVQKKQCSLHEFLKKKQKSRGALGSTCAACGKLGFTLSDLMVILENGRGR